MTYPYPGDTTSGLMSAVSGMSSAYGDLNLLASDITQAQSQLSGSWTGAAADKAKTDVGKLVTILPDLAKRMTDASTAVQDLENTINGIQIQIDGLRSDHAKYVTELQGYQTSIGRAARFGEANDMTPAEIDTYRSSLQADAKKVQGHLDDLDADYARLVKQANTATDHCCDKLKKSYQVSVYRDSKGQNVSLADGFGLDGLLVAHFDKMVADAKAFEKDSKAATDRNISPQERKKLMTALLAKYGNDVLDPVFATTVANDEGPDYFKKLQTDMATYQRRWGGGGNNYYSTDSAFYKFNAQILATATNQDNDTHVDSQWIHSFFYDSKGHPDPYAVLSGSDYMKLGVAFPKAFLDGDGVAAIKFEQEFKNLPNGNMGITWQQLENDRFAYYGGVPFGPYPTTSDPINEVMNQYKDNPDPTSVLFTDHTYGADGQPTGDTGYLKYLLHRQWQGDGAKTFGDVLDENTSGDQQNHAAAAQVAHDFILDLGTSGNNPIPDDLRDPAATIVGRYMESILQNSNSDPNAGLPGVDTNPFNSGINGEMGVDGVNLSTQQLGGAFNWIYHDTDDTAARETLAKSWAFSSHDLLGQTINGAVNAYSSDPGSYDPGSPKILNELGRSTNILGLMSQSDINGFKAAGEDQIAAAEARKQLFDTVTSFIPIPEVEGAGKVLSTAIDASADLLKGAVGSAFDADYTTQAGAAHANEVTMNAASITSPLAASTIAALSHVGLPVTTSIVNGQAHGALATVSLTDDPARLISDDSGHMKTYATILAESKTNPDEYTTFKTYLDSHTFYGGADGLQSLNATVSAQYASGALAAQQ